MRFHIFVRRQSTVPGVECEKHSHTIMLPTSTVGSAEITHCQEPGNTSPFYLVGEAEAGVFHMQAFPRTTLAKSLISEFSVYFETRRKISTVPCGRKNQFFKELYQSFKETAVLPLEASLTTTPFAEAPFFFYFHFFLLLYLKLFLSKPTLSTFFPFPPTAQIFGGKKINEQEKSINFNQQFYRVVAIPDI